MPPTAIMKLRLLITACAIFASAASRPAIAQEVLEVTPGLRYEAGTFHKWLLGSGNRVFWTTPVRVPVFDIESYAGGITFEDQGGGRQTRTLHLRGRDGNAYVFRSVDKDVTPALHADMLGTSSQQLLQDATSYFNPFGALLAPTLLDAVGVLHPTPKLYVMPDDPRLGKYRKTFAGMLGIVEARPEQSERKNPLFGNTRQIVSTPKLMDRIDGDARQRVDEGQWLTARFIDFLLGDTDRNGDQWRWAGFNAEDGIIWKPIPRDRDWALLNANGVVAPVLGVVFKKLVTFDDHLPTLGGLTFSSIDMDRRFLQSLDRNDWLAVLAHVQGSLSDDVITRAVTALPPEHQSTRGPQIISDLQGRRADLTRAARRFYERLAEDADVQATNGADSAAISRFDDGSVEVRLYRVEQVIASSKGDGESDGEALVPYYQRRFLPGETDEIRLYLKEGDDRAIVLGSPVADAIRVRLIGGAGDDMLMDSTSGGSRRTRTWIYDHEGMNVLIAGPHAEVSRRAFQTPVPPKDWLGTTVLQGRFRDWGHSLGFAPLLDYRLSTGVITGLTYTHTTYGFRRVPYQTRWRYGLMFAPSELSFGVKVRNDHYFENSRWSIVSKARASAFDDFRFYGFGNESSDIGSSAARVERSRIIAQTGLRYTRGNTEVAVGPSLQTNHSTGDADSPLELTQPNGAGDWTQFGVWSAAETSFAHDNATLSIESAYYPSAFDQVRDYGKIRGVATVYIGNAPTLALRGGGEKIWGDAPIFDAAFVGGRESLRGFSTYRFAGDASLYGNAELRVPVFTAKLLTRSQVGVFALGDAGRVYFGGDSPGGWHTSYGGGVWISSMTHEISIAGANGEDFKLYIKLGMPF